MNRISSCRVGLLRWNKGKFDNITRKLKVNRDRIERIHNEVLAEDRGQELRDIHSKNHTLLQVEEIKWKQQSKELWLTERDKKYEIFSCSCKPEKAKK